MTVYECWIRYDEDGEGLTFAPSKSIAKMLRRTEWVPLYSVRAESWEEAMTAHHEIQGWAPYVPMEK